MKSNKPIEVTVRTDLGLDAHTVLDYELKYRQYMERVKNIFHGYISFHHFAEVLSKLTGNTASSTKHIYRQAVEDKWLAEFQIGRYKFAYLKWKTIVCLTKNKKHGGDYQAPSTRQIVRSLLLAEIVLRDSEFDVDHFYMITDDMYVVKREKQAKIFMLDITKRKSLDYLAILKTIRDREEFKDYKMLLVTFCCYSPNRKDTLTKWFKHKDIKEFLATQPEMTVRSRLFDVSKYFSGDPIT
jgi:hypothetical protein